MRLYPQSQPRHKLLLISAILAGSALASAAQADKPQERPDEIRLTPDAFNFSSGQNGGTGTSGIAGIRTLVLKGNPNGPGLYTILLSVPAHTKIAAHNHPDERVATVISGTWRIGYGETFDEAKLKALTPGSFYTEPAGDMHFAETRDTPVIVQITGYGPSGTVYNNSADTPDR